MVGLSQSTVSRIELGDAGGMSLAEWVRTAAVLDVPVRFEQGRDPQATPADAGHLELQELLLRRGTKHGYITSAEVPTGAARWSVDVQWRSEARRVIVIIETWNAIGDIGASVRSFTRKIDETEAALQGPEPVRIAGCWVLRDVPRNRLLLDRYPHVFRAGAAWFLARVGTRAQQWRRATAPAGSGPVRPRPRSDRGVAPLIAVRHENTHPVGILHASRVRSGR